MPYAAGCRVDRAKRAVVLVGRAEMGSAGISLAETDLERVEEIYQ